MAAVWESFKMVLYIRWLPTLPRGASWDKGIREIDVSLVSQTPVDFHRGPGNGIYRRTPYLLYLCVIIPKVLVAMGLWWFGCKFLLGSEEDSDLILNAVALAFILDIDEIIGILVSTLRSLFGLPDAPLLCCARHGVVGQ